VLKPVRTIADLAGAEVITQFHLAEALQFRLKLDVMYKNTFRLTTVFTRHVFNEKIFDRPPLNEQIIVKAAGSKGENHAVQT